MHARSCMGFYELAPSGRILCAGRANVRHRTVPLALTQRASSRHGQQSDCNAAAGAVAPWRWLQDWAVHRPGVRWDGAASASATSTRSSTAKLGARAIRPPIVPLAMLRRHISRRCGRELQRSAYLGPHVMEPSRRAVRDGGAHTLRHRAIQLAHTQREPRPVPRQ